MIIEAQKVGQGIHFMTSGEIVISQENITIARVKNKDFFGEVSVMTKLPTTCDVISQDYTETLFIPRDIIHEICQDHPEIEFQLTQ